VSAPVPSKPPASHPAAPAGAHPIYMDQGIGPVNRLEWL